MTARFRSKDAVQPKTMARAAIASARMMATSGKILRIRLILEEVAEYPVEMLARIRSQGAALPSTASNSCLQVAGVTIVDCGETVTTVVLPADRRMQKMPE